jgi:outer membrane protein TolC
MQVQTPFAWVAGAIIMAFAQVGFAQTSSRILSLQACIDQALGRNLDLQIEHLNVDVAGYNLGGAYGAYDPTLSLKAERSYLDQPGEVDPDKAGADFPYRMTTDTVAPSLSGLLPIGLTYDVGAHAITEHILTDFRSNPGTAANFPPSGIRDTNNYDADLGVTVRQHLLKDFWIDGYREKLIFRRNEVKISQQALRFQVMKTVLAVELAYYDLIAAREQTRVAAKSVELKHQLLSETKRRVEVGDLPQLDAEQAETQLQNALTAQTAAQETMVDRQNTLKALLTDNFREWADADLQPAETLTAAKTNVNRAESFQNALRNRPDLMEARLAVAQRDVAIRFLHNQLFPSLDLIGHYGGLGSETSLGASIDDAIHFRNPEYFYGVVVSVPLGNIAARNDYKAGKASRQIAELQLKKAEEAILLQIATSVNRVQSRGSQVDSTRRARVYAEAGLAAEQKKLVNGLSTSFFVLQLQETLTAAQTAEIQALADYNKELAQLSFAEGSTLERQHLEVQMK